MKSDIEFLQSMWREIDVLEYEECQKQAAGRMHKKLRLRRVLVFAALTLVITAFALTVRTEQILLYPLSIILIVAGYIGDGIASDGNFKQGKVQYL